MQFLTSQVTRRGQHGKLAEVTVFAEKTILFVNLTRYVSVSKTGLSVTKKSCNLALPGRHVNLCKIADALIEKCVRTNKWDEQVVDFSDLLIEVGFSSLVSQVMEKALACARAFCVATTEF